MEEIVLQHIHKNGNSIRFDFSVTSGLADYFSGKPFIIEYPENIESVPDAVAAIPFVCNVLPIVWLTNSVLRVKELDESFYSCIANVKAGYETMFPESTFAGSVQAERIIPCDARDTGGSAAFFSGGLDAVNTLVCHLKERPALISIWGADIRFENAEGWDRVHSGIAQYAQKYQLPDVTIRSSFRDFDSESALHKKFSGQLKDGWWHGVKHGLGLLGHAAPYAYLHGLSKIYIASSNCPADGAVRCASNPLTDNQVRFANAQVIHDGFEFSRQDKVRNIVEYVRATADPLSVHVCWESQSGGNCCRCEKCYRTMVGLIAEGADPAEYGFEHTADTLNYLRRYLIIGCEDKGVLRRQWTHIQKRLKENARAVRKLPYWKQVRWMLHADFSHPESLKMPFHLRTWLSGFKFYQMLHNIKVKYRD